ncbi:MAG: hypothetical protein AB2L12_07150 [Smithellaceae bacterium]
MKQQQQIQKKSGSQYHLNLDNVSFAALNACRQIHRNHENHFSNSVIVRRALRAYFKFLENKITEERMTQEIIETLRSAKGVL